MSIQNCNSRIHLRSFRSAEIFYVYSFLVLLSCASAQEKDKNSAPPSPNPYALDTNFNPSMAIIIVVLISAFFFMGFFSVYIRQCAGEGSTRAGRSVRRTGPPGRSRRAARGLDPAVIETFPTFLYSIVKGLKIGKGTLECAVCLNEFEDEETLRLLPKCDHVFHPECIDAWLASHTTCPVCRANLAADSTVAENTAGVMDAGVGVTDSGSESDDEDHRNESVVDINENEDNSNSQRSQQPEVINPSLLPIQNRPVRLGSTRKKIFGKFPRSHSTGHSLIQPGENCDRYTLRLPEEVRKQIMLNRTTSCVSFPTVDRTFSRRSSRRGYRGAGVGGGEGSSRGKYYQFWKLDEKAKSDRWVFSMAPPFLSRASSLRSPKGADGEGSVNSKNFLTSVKKPFDCLSGKFDGNEEASSRPRSRPPV